MTTCIFATFLVIIFFPYLHFFFHFSVIFIIFLVMVYCSLFENSFILCCFLNPKIPQAHPIPPELTAKLLGNRVAVSPIVTVEPRRRKFHKPITLTIPVPQAAGKGMINQYNGETPTLRLLCSITGTFLV